MTDTGRLVIVGAGQAGFAAAAKLRSIKDPRPITIVGSEGVLPYQRPPLSKRYLSGDTSFKQLQFRPQEWYDENGIELKLSAPAERIDRGAKKVLLQDGSAVDYHTLLLATGSSPRKLSSAVGGELDGVYVMRDKRDADRLGEALAAGSRALIIGGGYIGLEAAAVARHRGLDVTLLEMADRILMRTSASETADIIRAVHAERQVRVLERTGLLRLVGSGGKVVGAELSDGSYVETDCVVVGIGVTPNDALANLAGLEVSNGIVVDAYGRSSDPSIYSAGDCANFPWRERRIRLESVQNAVDQAEAVALVIAGHGRPYEPKPWFWSDQYDVKLQIAGFNLGYDQTLMRHGSRDGSHSVWYFKDATLLAVDAINDATAYVVGRKLLELGVSPAKEAIADPTTDLKQLLRAA